MGSSPIKISLLGPVEISYQGQPLRLKRRIERAILYFLTVEHRPISRTTLIDIFWANEEHIDQRGALRTALSRLRKQLPDPDWIITDLDQVWLGAKNYQIDVFEFEFKFLNLHHILSTYQDKNALPQQIVDQIQEALAMWHGDTFIGGDDLSTYPEFEHWRQGWHWKLGYYRRVLLRRLADHYLAAGKLEAALELFIKLSSIDLLSTELHLKILDLMLRLGHHQEIIDYCDMLETIYEREFNAPLPDVILSKFQYAQIQINQGDDQNQRKWPSALTMQLKLIGRKAELDELQNCFAKGGLVTIRGELGIGKTRLVQELFQTMMPTPSLIVAPALDMENSLPFSPIIHALRNHISEEIWRDLDLIWVSQLRLIMPELTEIRTDIKDAQFAHTGSENQYLFDAVLHLLRLTAQRHGRMLFLLDNAHWADKQTTQLISYIVSHNFFKENGLLIIAYRPEERSRDLDILLGHLHRNYSVHQITLKGFLPSELALLANEVVGTLPAPPILSQLYQETNGNPLLALEIIRAIQELSDDSEKMSLASGLPIPESIRAIFRKRLNRLDDESRHTLLCAAILGNSFSLDTLAKITPMESSTETGTIDKLIHAGMIHAQQSNNQYQKNLQFTHEKLREVVLTEATPTRVQLLHHQAAIHLESETDPDTKAAIIAQHYLASDDHLNAFRWLLKAANHSWVIGAIENAVKEFQQAEKLTQTAPEGTIKVHDIYLLYKQWGEFAYQANQRDLLEQIALKLQFIGEKYQNPLMIGVSQMSLANVCFLQLDFELSLDFITKAIINLERTDERTTLIHAFLRQGNYFWWMNKFDETIESLQKAQEIINSLGKEKTPEKEALAFYAKLMTGMTYYARGEAARALEYAQIIYSYDIPRLKLFDQIHAYLMLSHTYQLSGQYSDAERYALKGMELTQDLKNEFIYEIFLILYSQVKFIKGDLDTAYVSAIEAQELGQKNGTMYTVVNANSLLGDIFQALYDPVRSFQFYRMAQIRSGYLSSFPQRLQNEIHLAYLLADLGQLSEARETLGNVIKTAQTHEMSHLQSFALCVLGLCDTIERDFSSAAKNNDQACAIAKEKHLKYELTISKLGQASIHLAQKRYAVTDKILKEFLAESKEIGHVWLQINGFRIMSQMYQAQNRKMPLEYQSMLTALIDEIQEHTQSEPLKDLFIKARQGWESGQFTP